MVKQPSTPLLVKDRSPDWEVHYSELIQKRLPRLSLDHFHIFFYYGGIHSGPRPFKFENVVEIRWVPRSGLAMVGLLSISGHSKSILSCKLKSLEKDLRAWNEQEFGNVETRKSTLFEELIGFEGI